MTDRDRRRLAVVAAAGLAAGAVLLLPLPGALQGDGAASVRAFAALAAAALVSLAVVPSLFVSRLATRPAWLAVAAISLGLGAAAFVFGSAVQRSCTARYDGRSVFVGTEWTALGASYRRDNPGLSTDELLFDSAGVADRLWTRPSIDRCRLTVSATYFAWIPLFIVCLFAAAQVAPAGLLPIAMRPREKAVTGGADFAGAAAASPMSGAGASTRYDVFISYRHGGADTEFARALLAALERQGYRVALDERDFPANASFLREMERCIRESRHTVAIISSRYLGSGNCEEEAIICRVLDMGDRQRRLIPMTIEPVAMPVWLYGLVGIDCTKPDPLVDPFEKLQQTLGPPRTVSQPT